MTSIAYSPVRRNFSLFLQSRTIEPCKKGLSELISEEEKKKKRAITASILDQVAQDLVLSFEYLRDRGSTASLGTCFSAW